MASTGISIQATSSSRSPPQWMYDVFLSFRGKDTRNNFTSHLYSNLVQRGIDVYMDDRELERGKTIEPALWKAIEDSRFSVVIFSRDYASSPWCLDELVKIVQCMKEMGHTVLPVFYDVDPSEVAEQKGNYKEPFAEHEQNFREKLKTVQSWKDCLTTVANLSGWDVRNRKESESIKKIVEYIEYKLSVTLPTISKKLVGIDSRLKVLNGYIGEEANGILFLGICGMGGMGKTTVARVIHDSLRWQFEGSCFLTNVREVFAEKDGSRRLQEQLLSEILMEHVNVWDSSRGIDLIKRRLRLKKVLLILDDVDDQRQLEMLAVEHGWFGLGSRIIVTTRNKNVLDKLSVTRIYEVDKLNEDDALMLFCWKAFKKDQPVEDFWEMSKKVVGYANGLPLALEVIGSFLHNRGILEWESAINRMNDIPDREIIDVLRISFDGLHELEKKIFLDIACFFKGMKKDRITRILDSCGFYTNIGIQVLIEKSLIRVSRDEIWMHNLLQKMGQEIVRCEFPDQPGRRSRLWAYKDVCNALKHSTGEIESIFVDRPGFEEAQWNMKAFSKMSKLRLLKIRNVQLSEGPEYLSNELRFLEWHAYPSKSLPAYLQLDMLVELDMSFSSIEQLGHGFKSSANLKIINLSYSINLTKTPDFTGLPNLENLNLEGCTSLSEVHPSLGHHKKLQFLNLVNCNGLRILPSKLEMESLKVCILDGCSKLKKFPDIVGNMNCLKELRLDGTGIAELPLSIHRLVGLGQLSMNNCKSLGSIPSCISGLKSLKKIDLSGCSQLKSIPENLGRVESLEEVDASGTSIRQLPVSIFLLKNLKVLSFDGCTRIGVNLADKVLPCLSGLYSLEVLDLCDCNLGEGAVPEDIGFLSSLRILDLSRNNFVSLPNTLNHLSRLEKIILEDCRMLESLPEVPSKVETVNLNGCIHLEEVPDPIKLSSLKISEFKCFNCWNLCKHNGQENIGLTMLKRYLQGKSNPRPGFGIVVPGNEILGCFKHQSKGSSIRVPMPCNNLVGDDSGWLGFVACIAFSACGESPSLLCHFKVNGRENYPSPMCISCNSISVLSDHLWLFCLSFDYLKELKEWKNESFSDIELSFHSYDQGVKVKNCGVTLVHSAYTLSFQLCSARLLIASKEAASSCSLGPPVASEGTVISHDTDSAPTSSDYQWMYDAAETSNNFTHLYTALVHRGFLQDDKELEKLKAVESRLLECMEESELSITIFGTEIAYSRWWLDEHVKIVNFMSEMRSDTVFPLFYEELWKMHDQTTRSYTIVFDKYEEDFSKNKKVQRWTDISTKVAVSRGSGFSERKKQEPKAAISSRIREVMGPVKLGGKMEIKEEVIKKACSMAMEAHQSPEKQYLSKMIKSSSSEVVISFAGSWSAKDWFAGSSFGEMKVDLQLFPSLKYIGLDKTATVNEVFLKRFKAVLANPLFKIEVEKAVSNRRQVVFTGHSSGGAIAILATVWFLEVYIRQRSSSIAPFCLTFGSPLVGDRIINLALRRENWSRYFVNFVLRYDIVPRISLSPLSSIKQQLQRVLDYFNQNAQQPPEEAPAFYEIVVKNALSVANDAACKIMGITNPLLETISNFIELSPYRPLGTYVFCTGNGKLVVISNPDAVLQVLFYSSQLSTENEEEKVTVAQTSLIDHLNYENYLQEHFNMPIVTCLDHHHPEALPLFSNVANVDSEKVDMALNDLGLSERARLCLHAAEALEKQKLRNQATIDGKQSDIEKCLDKLQAYKSKCAHNVGYYDAFKSSDEEEDFLANVERLELAGIWDEMIDMLKSYELPDEFEGRKAWIDLGTRYRRIVEPLDIANYYRHCKSEDIGPYMGKGRPRRYKCTQKWREHAEQLPNEFPGSCFWAEVEELCIKTDCRETKEIILHLKTKVDKWIQDGELGDDVLLENSTFKKLQNHHFLTHLSPDLAF